jgi:hypothetical protein
MRYTIPARLCAAIALAGITSGGAIALASQQTTPQEPRVNASAKALADFQEEVDEYLKMRRKLASGLDAPPKDATPEQLDSYQRALGKLIQQARRDDKQGDVFEREVRAVIRKLLAGVFTGPSGKKMKLAVMEENPGQAVKLTVNGRYPDTIPLSNMPPQVLSALPQLPRELEYRFIGRTLILFDTVSHIIVDYITEAVPR